MTANVLKTAGMVSFLVMMSLMIASATPSLDHARMYGWNRTVIEGVTVSSLQVQNDTVTFLNVSHGHKENAVTLWFHFNKAPASEFIMGSAGREQGQPQIRARAKGVVLSKGMVSETVPFNGADKEIAGLKPGIDFSVEVTVADDGFVCGNQVVLLENVQQSAGEVHPALWIGQLNTRDMPICINCD